MTNQPDVTVTMNINSGFITIARIGRPTSEIPTVSARAVGRAKGFPSPVSGPGTAV
jgi:hypothetical protein